MIKIRINNISMICPKFQYLVLKDIKMLNSLGKNPKNKGV